MITKDTLISTVWTRSLSFVEEV